MFRRHREEGKVYSVGSKVFMPLALLQGRLKGDVVCNAANQAAGGLTNEMARSGSMSHRGCVTAGEKKPLMTVVYARNVSPAAYAKPSLASMRAERTSVRRRMLQRINMPCWSEGA